MIESSAKKAHSQEWLCHKGGSNGNKKGKGEWTDRKIGDYIGITAAEIRTVWRGRGRSGVCRPRICR